LLLLSLYLAQATKGDKSPQGNPAFVIGAGIPKSRGRYLRFAARIVPLGALSLFIEAVSAVDGRVRLLLLTSFCEAVSAVDGLAAIPRLKRDCGTFAAGGADGGK
jgi:hypothetical protein